MLGEKARRKLNSEPFIVECCLEGNNVEIGGENSGDQVGMILPCLVLAEMQSYSSQGSLSRINPVREQKDTRIQMLYYTERSWRLAGHAPKWMQTPKKTVTLPVLALCLDRYLNSLLCEVALIIKSRFKFPVGSLVALITVSPHRLLNLLWSSVNFIVLFIVRSCFDIYKVRGFQISSKYLF